jgi:hypothetical protein
MGKGVNGRPAAEQPIVMVPYLAPPTVISLS